MDDSLQQMRDLAQKALAKMQGTIDIRGLRDEVHILRDTWGVPHIYATNQEDLFLSLGYTHAQERMWQMEFNKRLASGTLSEIIGEPTLDIDIYMRTIGLRRISRTVATIIENHDNNPNDSLIMAYVRGINVLFQTDQVKKGVSN
jgi:penicillin amidase